MDTFRSIYAIMVLQMIFILLNFMIETRRLFVFLLCCSQLSCKMFFMDEIALFSIFVYIVIV